MTFVEMRTKMLEHFAEMTKDSTELFEVSLDKDKLWDLYLESFPPEKNKIFRERREHDCSCCRHFIKTMGDDGTFTFYIDLVNQTFSKNSVIAKVKSIPINGMTIDEMFEVVRTTNWED